MSESAKINARERVRAWRKTSKGHAKKLAAQRRRVLRARQFILSYLLSHPCVDCGERDVIVLEFDHVRGQKKNNISGLISSGKGAERMLKEIALCDVVCRNDHMRRTLRRIGSYRLI